jgi:haloalkane dehalogenase
MQIERITREQADGAGSHEQQVLLEQSPHHYPEFGQYFEKEIERAGGELFFRGPSGNVYRVGQAQLEESRPGGIEICLRLAAHAAMPPGAVIDDDLWALLRDVVEAVGGEWSVEALLQTRRLSTMPRSVYKLFPFTGRFLKLRQRHYMHYVDVGEGEGKPTVVLLHGNPTWSFLYRDIIRKISGECRAIAPDYIGFGLSDKPREESWYTLENHTSTIIDFIDRLGLKNIILVLQDWGGPIGLGYALERLDNVAGMLLMNTWAWPQPSRYHASVFPWRMWHAPFVGSFSFERLNVLVEQGLFHATGSYQKMQSGPVLEGYQYPFPTPESRVAMLAFPRNIPLKPGDLNWDRMAEIERKLPTIPFPCRLLWGERDNVFPRENARKFQSLIPNCSAPRMIPHGRHFVQEDAPDEIAEEILALARHATK